jgi:EAL domain-containing protein (putative c-di-GMP-specific phosphodiesterase class I)
LRDEGLIDRILEPGALTAAFQPVYEERDGALRIHYLEALIRGPRGSSVESPNVLFEYARRKNRAAEVDRACVRTVLAAAAALPPHLKIGLNLHAATLALDPEFLNVLGDAATDSGIVPERLVVEIVEHAPPWDVSGFRNGLAGLRAIGVRVALDDIGLGHSNYMMILECRPEYFKIDRYFVHDAANDYYRKAVLASVAQLARPFGARVVAEGVETAADLRTAQEAGISLFQGWLLSGAHAAGHFGDTDDVGYPIRDM